MSDDLVNRLRVFAKEQTALRVQFFAVEAADRIAELQARVVELEGALRELIDLTHDCEKELTEKLYRVDFCAESLPLTNARAALEGKKDD